MRLAGGVAIALALSARAGGQSPDRPSCARSILDLQPARRASTVSIRLSDGSEADATLVDLNPAVGAWYLLWLPDAAGTDAVFHLEDAAPRSPRWRVESSDGGQRLELVSAAERCEIWSVHSNPLDAAHRSGLPYAPLCGERLYVRNAVAGTYTAVERVTQFLRDRVWHGDQIVSLVREELFRDAFVESGDSSLAAARPLPSPEEPAPAAVRASENALAIAPEHLGIATADSARNLAPGAWYPVAGTPGIYLSLFRPDAAPDALLSSDPRHVSALDGVESAALDYLVAFDLGQFELHYELGTDHPRLGWSERALPQYRNDCPSGPDGIDTAAPLARTGMVNPAVTARVIASFVGGFKREHGAFRYGALAQRNSGSHYGFIEQGTVFSRLQPGLATLYRTVDGRVELKTWAPEDDSMLDSIIDARQNGVPLIEYDPVTHKSTAGSLVNQWGAGNWSGSNDRRLRTVRAGLCLQISRERRYLMFGYFSAATPSAMTRVFQAYGCRYAMQLDINALEHTYLALYVHAADRIEVQHLVEGMAEVDRKGGDRLAPRFLGFPDDRDFFYLVRRETP